MGLDVRCPYCKEWVNPEAYRTGRHELACMEQRRQGLVDTALLSLFNLSANRADTFHLGE